MFVAAETFQPLKSLLNTLVIEPHSSLLGPNVKSSSRAGSKTRVKLIMRKTSHVSMGYPYLSARNDVSGLVVELGLRYSR